MRPDPHVWNEVMRSSLAHDRLNLILMPTEACNFRCTYCYEDFKLGRMAPRVVRGVKNLLARRAPELRQLDLSWFGGEPLLALDIVEDVLRYVGELQRAHPALHHESNMTTNAWKLAPDVFERLVGLGVNSYQISFDGPRELHDKKRVQANGRPTFDRIWKHVVQMRDVEGQFRVTLRLHVDAENDAAMPAFIDECRATFGADPRFDIFVRQLSRLGGPNDAQIVLLPVAEGDRRIAELRQRARGESAPPAASAAEPTPNVCYASRANSFVVRADGRLNKCTVALDHPRNQVGVLHESGDLEITSARMLDWMRGLRSKNAIELHCPLIGLDDRSTAPLAQAAVAR